MKYHNDIINTRYKKPLFLESIFYGKVVNTLNFEHTFNYHSESLISGGFRLLTSGCFYIFSEPGAEE